MKYTINNKTRINKYTVALATSTAMMASSSAATIAWGEFDLDTAVSEISTNGTLIEALNLVNTDDREYTDTTTINGVVFTATNLFDTGYYGDHTFGVSTVDANLDLLYLQANYNYDSTSPITLTGLTIGVEYELQSFFGYHIIGAGITMNRRRMLFYPSRSDKINGGGMTMNVGDSITIQKTSSGPVNNGAWIIGTFTADATTQNFHSASGSSKKNFISGYQLRDISSVPEPSSAVLIGLGGLALILRRSK